VKGDRVEIVVSDDEGSLRYEIAATRAGRRVEVSNVRGVVEVVEVTRTGQAVRTARFMASRVIALVEHPASERADAGEPAGASQRPVVGDQRADADRGGVGAAGAREHAAGGQGAHASQPDPHRSGL
jgi:hypothetical protein